MAKQEADEQAEHLEVERVQDGLQRREGEAANEVRGAAPSRCVNVHSLSVNVLSTHALQF